MEPLRAPPVVLDPVGSPSFWMRRLIPLLSLALMVPLDTAAQAPPADVLEAGRTELLVRMISTRVFLDPRVDLCLGLGGVTTPVEDPSGDVVRDVALRSAEFRSQRRFQGELKPFSECDSYAFEAQDRGARWAVPIVVEGLWLSSDGRMLTGHGHVGPTDANVLDCTMSVARDGSLEVDQCGVLHEHFGRTGALWPRSRNGGGL